ncbi:hypothetical protein AKJ09_08304 [Labilithrix luteola]|uniref:Uncharacterized protein n=1 Tax=Labilithrix luteola TaxID=1391654 RepID=A0A0K1Q732_9BACT|nr:hypothetical protein [Labilithrix luteola]AKV01641.1 hypothetical protein AKJ09_08304 [Labilithrix luteola]
MMVNAYRDDASSFHERLAALSAEVASLPAVTPLQRALLSPDKCRELAAVEARLREALSATPTVVTLQSLQRDVSELREFVSRIPEYLHATRSRSWPTPEPKKPEAYLSLGHSIDMFDRWGPRLERAYRFGDAVRSDFERSGIPMVLVAFAHGSTFGFTDQRMVGHLRAGVPSGLRVAAVPRRSLVDYNERARNPEIVVDPEVDAHFLVRGERSLAPPLFGPIRQALLAGRHWIRAVSVDVGAASVTWETVLVRDATIAPDWAVTVVTGIISVVRYA